MSQLREVLVSELGQTEKQNREIGLKSIYRTHTLGELSASDVGCSVTLSGWVHRKRDLGALLFLDMRDNYGVTQVVFSGQLKDAASQLRVESVITVKGQVLKRSASAVNPKIASGEIEVTAVEFQVLSQAEVLPFQVAEDDNAPETIRLKHRFLELRREHLHNNILLRSKVIFEIRKIMYSLGFYEFQTPILTSSSPEGARDFIVPSRHHPGRFFALPQAPQQFKQLLMVAGFDRYFQIAPCFRDEDPRADRSPGEFYQCDLEMSFVEQEDVFKACEQLFYRLFTSFTKFTVSEAPFTRLTYKQAMESYGIDKPDLRIEQKIVELSDCFKASTFKVFQEALANKGTIKALAFPVSSMPSRKFFDESIEFYKGLSSGAGLAYLAYDGKEVKGSIAKFVTAEEQAAILKQLDISTPSIIFFAAGAARDILPHLGKFRLKIGKDLDLVAANCYRFCWITDFPMYEWDDLEKKIVFSHNPFSMPQGGLEALNTKDPLDIYAYQYDVVCNGHELSSGAIRNHSPETMYRAFEIAGYSKDEVDSKFGGMIRAFKFGAPPHGGMAPGIDRIVMLLAQEQAIREVIAFPMSQTVEDLMMAAPCAVSERQLKEAHIRLA